MAKVNILRDAIRKNRVGLINNNELNRIFHKIEEQLTEYIENFDTYRYELRSFETSRLQEYQELLFSINEKIDCGKYAQVIETVNKAKKVRRAIDESLQVIKVFNKAEKLLETLLAEINADTFNQMPTIKILVNIIKEAESLMKNGRYQQAQVIISFCSLETEQLKSSTSLGENNNFSELRQRVEFLKKICADTAVYKGVCIDPPLEITGRVEYILNSFLDEGQPKLVGKLLDDLQILLGARKSFRDQLATNPSIQKEYHQSIQNALKKNGWIGGANYILAQKTELFKKSLEETEQKLVVVQSK